MCFHNYTQHSGCGHYGEVHNNRYTPCEPAFQHLLSLRGPSSPPLSPPTEYSVPSRSNTTKTKKRIFSLGGVLQRSATTSRNSSRRAVSGPEPGAPRMSTSSFSSAQNELGVADHELATIVTACAKFQRRTIVSSSAGQVCKECFKWIEHMRSMLAGYDKGRGVRGTPAFNEFLERREEPLIVAQKLGFWPPPGPVGFGPRRVIRNEGNDDLYD